MTAAVADAPSVVGVAIVVAWLGAVAILNRDPGRVLYTALAVGGAAGLLKAVTDADGVVWSIVTGLVACLALYLSHDRAEAVRLDEGQSKK